MLYVTDICELLLSRDSAVTFTIRPITPQEAVQLLDNENEEDINCLITNQESKTYVVQVLGTMLPMRRITRRPKTGDRILYIYVPEYCRDMCADTKLVLIEIV